MPSKRDKIRRNTIFYRLNIKYSADYYALNRIAIDVIKAVLEQRSFSGHLLYFYYSMRIKCSINFVHMQCMAALSSSIRRGNIIRQSVRTIPPASMCPMKDTATRKLQQSHNKIATIFCFCSFLFETSL